MPQALQHSPCSYLLLFLHLECLSGSVYDCDGGANASAPLCVV
jgi:hypothetical protein